MTTFARIVDGVAVEVGVQDEHPIKDDGSRDRRYQQVPDGVCVGHLFDGKRWTEPKRDDPDPAPTTLEERVAALEERVATLVDGRSDETN